MKEGRAHVFCSDEHGCVPGAQASKIGDEARVEGRQALCPEGLHKAIEHAGVLVGDVTCAQIAGLAWAFSIYAVAQAASHSGRHCPASHVTNQRDAGGSSICITSASTENQCKA